MREVICNSQKKVNIGQLSPLDLNRIDGFSMCVENELNIAYPLLSRIQYSCPFHKVGKSTGMRFATDRSGETGTAHYSNLLRAEEISRHILLHSSKWLCFQ